MGATGKRMGPRQKKDDKVLTPADETFVCPHCGKTKKRGEFYVSRDERVVIGVSFPCKICSENIARNYNPKTKSFGDVTKPSLMRTLEYLDLPFLETLWESAVENVNDESKVKNRKNAWAAYITLVNSLHQYRGLRWRDSDHFKTNPNESNKETEAPRQHNVEVIEEYEKNRKDVIRLIGYDPFDKESEEDKPLLYAQLIGYIDAEGNNDDMTRILDSIEIVRGYLQLQKLNDMSAKAFAKLAATGQSGEIKNYMDTKKKVADVISQLAEQSCISLKHNKNATKGENTWTGKIKKLRSMNLREAEVNAFTIGTCEGMKQVADISNASILKQIRLDESDYIEMIATQRSMITDLQSTSDANAEKYRILLQENYDLKSLLKQKNIDISEDLHECELIDEIGCVTTDEENEDI